MTLKLFHYTIILLWVLQACTTSTGTTPATALHDYLQNGDESFNWEISGSYESGNLTVYNLLVTSQEWRGYKWRHQVAVIVPEVVDHDGALLFISGGSNQDEMPNWKKPDDGNIRMMEIIAQRNQAVVAVVFQVPNQPLYDGLTEDELISLTFHNFRNDNDYTWPLLFPMVKSAVRAMDAVQAFADNHLGQPVTRFVVSGASKRGWTTWLTGANDSRVAAIAPMVIDMLNMPASISYHLEAWGDYSIQIQDYVKLGIAQDVSTPDGKVLTAMVDPYSYRQKLTMPKLIVNGTNDEYWPVDAIKHYINEIPGQNCLHYVPNAGHDLGDKRQAIQALSAFFGQTLRGGDYPSFEWELDENKQEVILSFSTLPEGVSGVRLWSTDSGDRDFRDNRFTDTPVDVQESGPVKVVVPFPESGFRAFYVDLIFPDHLGDPYSVSTRMFVVNTQEVL